MARLTNKQRAFIEYYLTCWNATEAARLAGYKGNDVTLASVGYENLRKPQIAEVINQRLAEMTLSANEVLARLTDQATASMANFVKPDDEGHLELDLEKAASLGKLHLVKKIGHTKYGLRIELYDSQQALVHLGRHHALFTDKVAPTDPSGEFPWNPYTEMSDEELNEALRRMEQRGKGALSAPETGTETQGSGETQATDPDNEETNT